MMAQEACPILIIDPNPVTVTQLQQQLLGASALGASALLNSSSVQLDTAPSVEAGFQLLQEHPYRALLLEITLFDDFHSHQRSCSHSEVPDVPIIIISEVDEEVLAVRAIEGGAYGYLLTSRLTGTTLLYSLRFAMQKHAQLKSLIGPAQQQVQEMEGWEQLVRRDASPSLTAQLFDAGSLRETVPDIFAELVEDYGRLLDQALERRAYRIEATSENPMRALAEQLGFLKASPRDVIEMHTYALRAKTMGVLPEKASAYMAESRLTVLEVMGDLVTYYRRYFIGLSKRRAYPGGRSS